MTRALLDLRHNGRIPISLANRLRVRHRARRRVLRELDRLEAQQKNGKSER